MERKLAAIFSADVQGYSRLMGEDEEATIRTLTDYREVMAALIRQHHGRVVDSPGDNLLAEFPSAVDAVQGAVAIQRELKTRNAELPASRQMAYRIGINVGDVVVEGERVYGDGVNIAARLESLAEGGGICLSGTAYDHVKNKLALGYEYRGEQTVKNIAEPVRVYKVQLESETATPSVSREKTPTLALPDKPSIAVLPFTNMSGDPEQEYFSDGITEDIITELSRFPDLLVIARNSTFVYKSQAVKIQAIGRELGVHYVLEGSVRKAGTRVRITVQLVDALTGKHHWAERYDRNFDDIFAIQDEVTQSIVATLPGRLEVADLERVRRKPTDNLAAYEYVLRGKIHHHRGTKEDNAQALRMLEKAVELDPGYPEAHAWLACTLGQAEARGYISAPPDVMLEQIIKRLQTAYALDENNTECLRILCEIDMERRQYEQAEVHNEKALHLNPNDPRIVAQRGELLTWLGKPEESVEWIEKALRLDPYGAEGRAHLLGQAFHSARRYPEAIKAFNRITLLQHKHHAFLAACYAQIGNDEEAKAHAAEVLRMKPDFSVASYLESLPYKNQTDRQHYRDGLLKAGLPE
jgi:adenylate cyclase